jgi:hypothetical protein
MLKGKPLDPFAFVGVHGGSARQNKAIREDCVHIARVTQMFDERRAALQILIQNKRTSTMTTSTAASIFDQLPPVLPLPLQVRQRTQCL